MKNWILAVMAILVCGVLCTAVFAQNGTALAEAAAEVREGEMVTGSVHPRISDEQAEREYMNGLFGLPVTPVEDLPRMRGTTGYAGLTNDVERNLYNAMKARAALIAKGDVTETIYTFTDTEQSGMTFILSRTDLELTASEPIYGADGYYTDNVHNKVVAYMSPYMEHAFDALLYDCPYELYWMDRGDDCFGWNYGFDPNAETVEVFFGAVYMKVSASYRDETATGNNYGYVMNANKIESVNTAVANAQAVVTQNAFLDDYEKLTAYKRTICGLTAYNSEAAASGSAYGDPWQLVWVFDGDPATNVVCEGYSKAFQYLCDKSRWNKGVDVISVSGTMDNGPHMWNIVTMNNGKHYLADLTNSDTGGCGAAGGLFLNGYKTVYTAGADYGFATGNFSVSTPMAKHSAAVNAK